MNYSFNDHVMDNYRMRPITGMKMLSNVARETLNSRLELTTIWTDRLSIVTGVDSQHNTHTSRGGLKYTSLPRQKNMTFESYGAFSKQHTTLQLNKSLYLVLDLMPYKFKTSVLELKYLIKRETLFCQVVFYV